MALAGRTPGELDEAVVALDNGDRRRTTAQLAGLSSAEGLRPGERSNPAIGVEATTSSIRASGFGPSVSAVESRDPVDIGVGEQFGTGLGASGGGLDWCPSPVFAHTDWESGQ